VLLGYASLDIESETRKRFFDLLVKLLRLQFITGLVIFLCDESGQFVFALQIAPLFGLLLGEELGKAFNPFSVGFVTFTDKPNFISSRHCRRISNRLRPTCACADHRLDIWRS
jgi:hypothetical protein